MTENTDSSDISLMGDDDFWKDMSVDSTDPKRLKSTEPEVSLESDKPAAKTPVETPVTPPVASEKPTEPVSPIKSVRFSPNELPTLRPASSFNSKYQETVENVLNTYSGLPKIDYDKIYKEIKQNLSIKSEPTPDAQSINQLLERIQAAKDRLSEILVDVIRSYNFKKRTVDILRETWMNFSTEKTVDKRKAESHHVVSNFEMDLACVENLFKVCVHVFKNLEGLHDSVSRRITIMQVCLKYSDMGRGILPDFSFGTFSRNLNDDSNLTETPVDPTKSIEAEEQDFGGM